MVWKFVDMEYYVFITQTEFPFQANSMWITTPANLQQQPKADNEYCIDISKQRF